MTAPTAPVKKPRVRRKPVEELAEQEAEDYCGICAGWRGIWCPDCCGFEGCHTCQYNLKVPCPACSGGTLEPIRWS